MNSIGTLLNPSTGTIFGNGNNKCNEILFGRLELNFKSGDIVTVHCDLLAKTISYGVNNLPLMLAYTDVQNLHQLHPVVFYLWGAARFI